MSEHEVTRKINGDGTYTVSCPACPWTTTTPVRGIANGLTNEHPQRYRRQGHKQASIGRYHPEHDFTLCYLGGSCTETHQPFAYCPCGKIFGGDGMNRAAVEEAKKAHRLAAVHAAETARCR